MITEELMKPRYKVIAMYPGSHHEVGCVLHKTDYGWGTSIKNPFTPGEFDFKGNPDLFPAIFKKLQWWEERKPEDMPEYVKMIAYIKPCTDNAKNLELKKNQIIKPDRWGLNSFEISHWVFSASLCIPATESDYLTYKQSNQ